MKISNEFKIGIATIVAIIVLVFGIQYLKGINALRKGHFYYLTCENVSGLAVSSHVLINGLQVGLVRSMEYDYAKTGKVIVTINIEDDIRIPRDSRIQVQADLLGTSNVVINLGQSSDCYADNDTVTGGDVAPGLLDSAAPIMASINNLMPKVDSLITGINVLVNDSKLQESLLEINTLTQRLNVTVSDLNRLLRNDVPVLMKNLGNASANLDTLSTQVKDANVARLLADATQTLEKTNALLSTLQRDNGTVGKLVNTTELHDQLTNTIANMDSLIGDIKANPKRYINIKVFGK